MPRLRIPRDRALQCRLVITTLPLPIPNAAAERKPAATIAHAKISTIQPLDLAPALGFQRHGAATLTKGADQTAVHSIGMIPGETWRIRGQREIAVFQITEERGGGEVAVDAIKTCETVNPVTELVSKNVAARKIDSTRWTPDRSTRRIGRDDATI